MLGFPVGEEYSFSTVALCSFLPNETEAPNLLGYINLRSGLSIADVCRQQKIEILVLQLGHYETMPKLRKIFKTIFHLHNNRRQKACIVDSCNFVPEPNKHYQRGLYSRFLHIRRIICAYLLVAIGQRRRMFDPTAAAASLDSILSSLKPLHLGRVFLLSPFSCDEPVVRACRLQAIPIFIDAAKKHGCVYIDAFGMLESYGKGKDFLANFSDSIHLSRLGHQRVGLMVGKSMCVALEDVSNASFDAWK